MNKLKFTNYDDTLVRNAVIEFFKKTFDINLFPTPPNLKLIDLTGDTESSIRVEVEHGKWNNDFWENEKYSLISNLGFQTINIPIRKEKYWLENYTRYGTLVENKFFLQNLFVRSNKNFTQFIVIKPEIVRDPTKCFKSKFQPNNSYEVEEFLSFKREDVETYNLVNDIFILDKSYESQQSVH